LEIEMTFHVRPSPVDQAGHRPVGQHLIGASPGPGGPRRQCAALTPLVAGLTLVTLAATSSHPAAADTIPDLPDPAPAIALAVPDRPYAVDGALYWQDHRLAGLCSEVGGTFLKLRGSSVYACHERRLAEKSGAEEIDQ
jgi:hypothetical protein